MGKKSSYLSRLPEHAQRRGRARLGEAEIVTGRKKTRAIRDACGDDLKGSALGKNGKRLGVLLEDEVRMVVRDALLYPGDVPKCEMRVIGKTEFDGVNGVAVICVSNSRFVLREIFRHPTRSWELETTRGRRETGQTPQQAARAEVKQELGYRVTRLRRLGRICPETALMSSVIELFLADLPEKPEGDSPEEGEAFGRIVHLAPDELSKRIAAGRIRDSYTLAGLMLAQLRGFIPVIEV